MKRFFLIIAIISLIVGCGQSYEETKRLNQAQRLRMFREDSAALKVAVMPTLDCLPVFVAKDRQFFDTAVDIRLKQFTAQMDCDTALMRHRVEGSVTDLVRAERMMKSGVDLKYWTSTNAYWLLISNRQQRINDLKHLDDKMVAMTRFSATDLLTDRVIDSVKLDKDRVYKVQINDLSVRLLMLQNNEMDALWLSEPQATAARTMKHGVVYDTQKEDVQLGVLAFNEKEMRHQERGKQLELFVEAYNQACDSINKYGVRHYRDLIVKRCKMKANLVDSLPKNIKYVRARGPREQDVALVEKWLGIKKKEK